jgi:hypothetical protein
MTRAFEYELNMRIWVMMMQKINCNKTTYPKCLITHSDTFEESLA